MKVEHILHTNITTKHLFATTTSNTNYANLQLINIPYDKGC